MAPPAPNGNQFVAGPAVSGAKFFGRDNILSTICGAAESGMSILLVGERRVGKSSILKQVKHLLSGDPSGEFAQTGQCALIEVSGLVFSEADKTPEFIRQLAQRVRSWIEKRRPDLADTVAKLVPHEIDPLGMSECLSNLREHDVRVLLLFDELDAAVRDGPRQTAAVFRQMITEGQVVAIATSFEEPDQINRHR
jgi:ABC-type arginine transport system ATPase subunit